MNELELALNKYFNHFGCNYPLGIASLKPEEEIIKEIDLCIKTNQKAPEPQYDEDQEY